MSEGSLRHFATSSLLSGGENRRFYEQEERETQILDSFFFNCFDYLRANDLAGDYTEFGCGHIARSFRLAAKYREQIFPGMRLFGFDSFAGLPALAPDEFHPHWKPGAMALSLDDFHSLMALQGFKRSDYSLVRGFYRETLSKPASTYGLDVVSFAFIDCDVGTSTAQALAFLGNVLCDGAILAFDDWNCYRAHPDRGQRKAFADFTSNSTRYAFESFLSFGWHGHSFLAHRQA